MSAAVRETSPFGLQGGGAPGGPRTIDFHHLGRDHSASKGTTHFLHFRAPYYPVFIEQESTIRLLNHFYHQMYHIIQ